MSTPKVTITELDGSLGVLPPSAGKLLAIIGVAEKGTKETPATYARITDLSSDFGVGPMVEAAARAIERTGRPVVVVRTEQSTAGSAGSVTQTGTGDSVASVDGAVEPLDDFEVQLDITDGGTVGTGPILFTWSLDGGRTKSAEIDLDTANTFTIPNSGVKIDFAAGDLDTGDKITFRTSAPQYNGTELNDALDALLNSVLNWEIAHVVGPLDGTLFDNVDSKISGGISSGKYRAFIGNTRIPTAGESEADYKSSLDGVFAAKSTSHGELCSGAAEVTSSVSGRKYLRPCSFVVADRESAVSEEQNIANVNLGALKGVSIRDTNGNPKHHDEAVNPGLDDSRFTVLRTHEGLQGVYVNRPRIFSSSGSDFRLMPHRRVLNIAHGVLRTFFIRRLNKPVLVDADTGFILESEAEEIEAGAKEVMRAALLTKPKASAIQFTLNRNDNLLSTQTMTGTARVIPVAYPEFINLEVGFLNPALQTVSV